jgi:DNA-binding Lrp family transcriptional regulator
MGLDKIDRKIIEILQGNGRITNSELSNQIGISPPPTLERVRKLERKGVIRRYVALVDPASVGIDTFTFVEVTLIRHGRDAVTEFLATIEEHPEIMECHHITGDADFLLKIAVSNFPAYQQFVLQTLTDLPFVQNLKTMVVLSTTKNETVLPINHEDEDE